MEQYADLEIGLYCRDVDRYQTDLRFRRYQIDLRFSRPDSHVKDRLVQDGARFDQERLGPLMLDDVAYGTLLGESLLGFQNVRSFFDQARVAAQTLNISLRVRLVIDPAAPELHSLRWETLRDPLNGEPLFTNESLPFSRYVFSHDYRRVNLRPQADLRALVAIANPNDIEQFNLVPLHVDEELKRAKAGLGTLAVTELVSGGKATLKNLVAHLRDGYDILYLIAHGTMQENDPLLWLEDESGKARHVQGNELVTQLRELSQRPRLIVLASCQSAGTGQEARTGDEGVLAALGPRLAEAGIPAIIAMQGNITIRTVNEFMPVFFEELQRDGQIDRAMAVARGVVRERFDWWMPVLFMRLQSGRIWYNPGFAKDRKGTELWPALMLDIKNNRCTPILGPGLSECLLGSHQQLARRWAEKYHFPMAAHNREELPHVAQYLAIDLAPMFPRDSLIEYIHGELLERYRNDLPETLQEASLEELLRVLGDQLRKRNPAEPYRILAEMPFPVYINTNPGNLLADALRAAGKKPRVELCRWNEEIEYPSVYDDDPDYKPSVEQPLVYHLFGGIQDLESLVLTEDDYFDYLLGVSRNDESHDRDSIRDVVDQALTNRALLFLGFQIDDWNLRVMFRYIMSLEGAGRLRKRANIAAQITPEEGRVLEPKRVRRYLEKYFQNANIDVYWGSTEDFVQELQTNWKGGMS